MKSVIEQFQDVKNMPEWGKNKALPEPNRTVLKVNLNNLKNIENIIYSYIYHSM